MSSGTDADSTVVRLRPAPGRRCGGRVSFARLSAVALVAVFGGYCVHWFCMHGAFLFDPALQNDDARTALFPFHQYGENPWLARDPIAREMMAYVSPGLWLLYRFFVPLTNLYVASKCVQGLALGVLVTAGCVLARSRRAGLAAGLLLIFLVLSDSYAVGRIAGGHARAFAFPCFALWVAGVIARRRWARAAAPIVGSLLYPAVMLMIITAEAFYALRRFGRIRLLTRLRRIRRTVVVAGACGLFALPSLIGGDTARGPIHTLAQAEREPAFYRDGRLWVLPLGDPSDELMSAFITRFSAVGVRLIGGKSSLGEHGPMIVATCVLGFFVWLRWQGWVSALSASVAAFLCGSMTLYFASRVLAFRLYSTERYYAYCMRMVTCLLLVGVTARLIGHRHRTRDTWRNVLVSGMILSQWIFLGDGIVRNNGMTLNAGWDADLYHFIRTLPINVRFASHPMDGDGIPYYSARATVGTFETLQPWFVDSWQRQKAHELATLDALYSPRFADLLSYGRSYSVTHLLINRDRYGTDYKLHTASFEPFTSYLNRVVGEPNREPPALTRIPAGSIVFDRPPWLVVDLDKLRRCVAPTPAR